VGVGDGEVFGTHTTYTVRVFSRPGQGSTEIPSEKAFTVIDALGRPRRTELSVAAIWAFNVRLAKHPVSAFPYVRPTPK